MTERIGASWHECLAEPGGPRPSRGMDCGLDEREAMGLKSVAAALHARPGRAGSLVRAAVAGLLAPGPRSDASGRRRP